MNDIKSQAKWKSLGRETVGPADYVEHQKHTFDRIPLWSRERTTLQNLYVRYYDVPPEFKTVEQCRSHGQDHKAYGWIMKIDPRWSWEQEQAYLQGYGKVA